MGRQTIDTNGVRNTIEKVHMANETINHAFETMTTTARNLERVWISAAGTAAQTTMCQIFKGGADRSNVLDNYCNVLNQLVCPGYVDSEEVNRKLADQFK